VCGTLNYTINLQVLHFKFFGKISPRLAQVQTQDIASLRRHRFGIIAEFANEGDLTVELKNARLIPQLSDGIDFPYADILIENRKIKSVRPASGTPAGPDDVDCRGMTVIPGFFDLHIHLVNVSEPNDIYHAFQLYHKVASKLDVFLEYGVTTVRDCGSTMDLGCYLREGVDKGLFSGPRILTSGRIISPEAMRHKGEGGVFTIANGVEEMVKTARREFANGADFLKLYATQSMSQVRGQDPKCIYTPEEISAAVAVAKSQNSYVAAHAHSTDAINTCIQCGVRSIEHATYMDDDSFRLLLETPDAYIVPTSAVAEPYRDGDGYNDPEMAEFWRSPYMIESSKRCRSRERQAYLKGIAMGIGTDLGPEDFVKYPYEFRVRKESCGMENIDILLQATKISAKIAMLEDVTGEVREGLAADLIAFDGNPDQDIEIMYKKPSVVMKDGIIRSLS
jgi:imidazolonepropionase-like amidohydrolase